MPPKTHGKEKKAGSTSVAASSPPKNAAVKTGDDQKKHNRGTSEKAQKDDIGDADEKIACSKADVPAKTANNTPPANAPLAAVPAAPAPPTRIPNGAYLLLSCVLNSDEKHLNRIIRFGGSIGNICSVYDKLSDLATKTANHTRMSSSHTTWKSWLDVLGTDATYIYIKNKASMIALQKLLPVGNDPARQDAVTNWIENENKEAPLPPNIAQKVKAYAIGQKRPLREVKLFTYKELEQLKHLCYDPASYETNYIISAGDETVKIGYASSDTIQLRISNYRTSAPRIPRLLVVCIPNETSKKLPFDTHIKKKYRQHLAVTLSGETNEWCTMTEELIQTMLSDYAGMLKKAFPGFVPSHSVSTSRSLYDIWKCSTGETCK